MSAFLPVPYFFSLLVWLELPVLCWNKSGESGNPCVVPDLRGNTFRVSLLRMMTASPIGALLHLSMFPLYSLFIIINGCWIQSKHFFLHNLKKSYDFYFSFVNAMYHIDGFADTEPALHPQNKFGLFIDYNCYNVLLISISCKDGHNKG